MDNINTITVFTPTYNRAQTLSRVYNSLINQTEKNFLWLIIDDGSTDNTKELVERWKTEGKLEIEYHFKINGGKHTAMRLANQIIKTKYLLAIDSDDELKPNAVETFYSIWKEIEASDLEGRIAEVRAETQSKSGDLVGNYKFPSNVRFIDSFWQEMVLNRKNNNEHVTCWNSQKLKECANIPEEIWLSNKINFFGEMVLWARLGKVYKTRYINKKLRIYYYDGGESLTRTTNYTKSFYNNIVYIKYFLDENLSYFNWNPKYFLNLILKFIISGIELRLSPIQILKKIESQRFFIAYLLCFPIGFVGWFYFKFVKRRFWF